jgi:hypothetical protein
MHTCVHISFKEIIFTLLYQISAYCPLELLVLPTVFAPILEYTISTSNLGF